MALCYLAQRRLAEAEATVLKGLAGRLEMLDAGKIEFSFSDYELAEVYARVLREQRRYGRGRAFLADLLGKSASASPKPARSLAELSLVLVELDEATYGLARGTTGEALRNGEDERLRIDELMSRAHLIFKDAAAAYELEWNRGTWVF